MLLRTLIDQVVQHRQVTLVDLEHAVVGAGVVQTRRAKLPEAAEAVKQFAAIKYDPEAYTLYTYAAVQVVVDAANAVKANDPKKVAEEIKKGGAFKTVIGELKYDKKGDITRPDYVMYTWKKGADGKVTYVQN